MKMEFDVQYEDGFSEKIIIEKPSGAHPSSFEAMVEGILQAEKHGKKVSNINGLSRVEVLKEYACLTKPIPDKYILLYE